MNLGSECLSMCIRLLWLVPSVSLPALSHTQLQAEYQTFETWAVLHSFSCPRESRIFGSFWRTLIQNPERALSLGSLWQAPALSLCFCLRTEC